MHKTNYLKGLIAVTAFVCGSLNVALAETLYQWEEADGSLTFSPNPPPEGSQIEYRVLNTGGSTAADIKLPETTLSASTVAENNRIVSAQTQARRPDTGQQQDLQQLTYATASKNALPQGISRSVQEPVKVETAADNTGNRENLQEPQMMASSQKSNQCADLGKRIMALENRIVISSSADEMDQAILQISRYQRSYSSHCE